MNEKADVEEQETSSALLDRLRQLVHHYREKHRYKSALFWADKVASLSKYEVQDVYNLAQCMYSVGEYERAAIYIVRRGLHENYNAFRYLAAKCYAECKEWQSALELLEDSTYQVIPKKLLMEAENVPGVPTNKEMQASLLLLKGDIYEARDTRQYAAQCYEEALHADVFCYEAYDRLISHHLLDPNGEQELLKSLPLSEQCQSDEEKELLTFLYGTKITRYTKPDNFEVPRCIDHLHENLEVATSLAERHYYSCEFKSSYKITSGILRCDPYHPQCLPLHIVLLVVLKKSNELFYLSHKLIKLYPGDAVSWFSVGCYYLLQPKNQELTRRYLLKSTTLDKMYGPAWLALGHSFAMEGEHDQAMAAYFTATQLMKGSHLPYLYSGMEYSVTNNVALTEKFFSVALAICPDDPHTLHEIGVASYSMNNYPAALNYFNKALGLLRQNQEEITSEEWEALLNNLGHVHRKMKNYDLALKFHKQALVLAPHCAQIYSSIGFVLSYLRRYGEALEYLHKALGLQRDDVFAVNLLEHVMTQYSEEEPAFMGGDAVSEDDLGPPPPFSHASNEGGDNLRKCGEDEKTGDDTQNSQSSSAQSTGLVGNETETPGQTGEKAKASMLGDDGGAYHTPEEFIVTRSQPPALRGLKKMHPKNRRVISSPVPSNLNFAEEHTPSSSGDAQTPAISAVLPQSSRQMLSLSSESSDDVGHASAVEAEGVNLGQTSELEGEVDWSTVVLKGGGRGFGPGESGVPGVSDREVKMLGGTASVPLTFEASADSPPSSRASMSNTSAPTDRTRSQGCKRSRDDIESSDMELDDTLD